jgi:hypothetical protein
VAYKIFEFFKTSGLSITGIFACISMLFGLYDKYLDLKKKKLDNDEREFDLNKKKKRK